MNWTKKNSSIATLFSLCIIIVNLLVFPEYIMSLPILMMGICIILFFYFALNFYANNWIATNRFEVKLFLHSLIYRSVAVLGMYTLTYYYDRGNLPMEIGAADAWNYHISGELVANTIHKGGNIFDALSTFWKSENDYGFSIYIGFIYSVFGPYVTLIKLLNGLLGSFTVVRLYQISRIAFDERTARLSGIIAMIFPTLLWFSSMNLKETLLIFLLINIAYYIYKITLHPDKWYKFSFFLVLFLIPIYFFRVFLVPLVIISLFFHLILYRTKIVKNKLLISLAALGIIIAFVFIIRTFKMQENFVVLIDSSTTNFNNELSHSAVQRGISYKQALVAPFILIGAVITPLPSLLHFNNAQLTIYMHYQNELVRNAMYFFVFVSLYFVFKRKNRKSAYLVCFALGYILILALSGVSFQDRYQVLALPFLLIFMANGILIEYPKKNSQWRLYLFFIAIAILSWNVFKLSIRELI